MATRHFKYALRNPIDWGDDAAQMLARQHTLWNRLVEIEREYHEPLIAAIGAATPDLVIASSSAPDQIVAASEPTRQSARRIERRVSTPAVAAGDIPSSSDELVKLLALRSKAVVQAVESSGVWGPNGQWVYTHFSAALADAQRGGRRLSVRQVTEEGRYTCAMPDGIRAQDLFDSANALVRLDPVPETAFARQPRGERRRQQRTQLTIKVDERADGSPRTLTFPMAYHRPLPDEGIAGLIVTRRRLGNHWRWDAIFTVDFVKGV